MTRTSCLAALALAGSAAAAQAKPLYITVPRSFTTREPATVEVAFKGTEPVELRVLRPTDLDAFLVSQSNLRRAYQPPPATVNPGRMLARGLNAVHGPGGFLLRALSVEFRTAAAPAAPKVQRGLPLARFGEGSARLVGIPPGMTLVRSEWLNLDLGGTEREFSVPGFALWGGYGGYQERRVHLAALPAGIYVLQLVQERVEGQVVLVITDLAVQVKQTDGEVLARVAGSAGQPVSGARVQIFLPSGKGPSAITDAQGEARLSTKEPKLLLLVRTEADAAVVDTDFYSTLAVAPDVFIYGDRPIYKPGDEVRFRGIVRKPDSFLAALFTPRRRQLSVALELQGRGHATARAQLDDFGCFNGKLRIPEDAEPGVLRLEAALDEQKHQSEARVQQYVKPSFYLELLGDQESIQPGGAFRATVRARRYAGGAAAGARYEVFLYRTLLDSPAWIDDAGLGAKGSALTYGSPASSEGRLSVPERLYSSVAQRLSSRAGEEEEESSDPWSSAAQLDANGEASIEVPVPALQPGEERLPFRYTLTVRARDDQGTFANASKALTIGPSDVLGAIAPSAKVALVGSEAAVSIRATALSGKPYPGAKGTAAFFLRPAEGEERKLSEANFETGPDGVWRGPLPTPKAGTLAVRVELKDKQGRPWSGEETMLIAGREGEAVARVPALTAQALGGALDVGDAAQVVALFPDRWSAEGNDQGKVWLTLSGTGLFETRLLQMQGRTLVHSFPIERRFGSAVYASVAYPNGSGRWQERTVAFRIVPRERALTVRLQPQQVEVSPLGRQTVDLTVTAADGRGVVAQLSFGVVDKAIYALQSEFRPRVLDFFYPLARDNVSTFQSAEFQGYGYGESLAQLIGRGRSSFAAIKPPTHRPAERDRDTAYWNPAVITDDQGHARVSFDMPSNQTLWVATAVAADALGRFGESTAEFASRGEVNLVAALPQFLREGDEAAGSLRLGRPGSGPPLQIRAELHGSGAIAKEEQSKQFSLPGASEQLMPISLKAGSAGAAAISFRIQGTPEPLSGVQQVPVRAAVVEDVASAQARGGGELSLEVPAGGRVMGAEILLQPSTVEAALQQLRDLLDYPYGCTEQLVATTIPNLAVYRTLDSLGVASRLDPESRALLAQAQSRSQEGLQRILARAAKSGGFRLWDEEVHPQPAITLIALDGLSYAVEASLVPTDDPVLVQSEKWIAAQDGLGSELEATRAYVLARLQKKAAAPLVRAQLSRVAPGDLHSLSFVVLAAVEAGVADEPELRARVLELAEAGRAAFLRNALYEPDDDTGWRYPLRQAGFTALLGHAASHARLDPAEARARLLQILATPGLSTFDRSVALLHGIWILQEDARRLAEMQPPSITPEARWSRRAGGLLASLPAGTARVQLGAFEGVATLRARIELPAASAPPLQAGLSLQRDYFVLGGGSLRVLKPGERVTQGEEVFVQLRIDARGGPRHGSPRSAYQLIEDAVPAGFVLLTEDQAYRGKPYNLPLVTESLQRRILGTERATFFLVEQSWWADSPRAVGYVMRAQFPGKFVAPPATAVDMYAPAVRARTSAATLLVSASQAK